MKHETGPVQDIAPCPRGIVAKWITVNDVRYLHRSHLPWFIELGECITFNSEHRDVWPGRPMVLCLFDIERADT